MNKNYGFDLDREKLEQDGTEYLAGSISCIAEIPYLEREKYLPKGEIQRGKEDMKDCATRAPLNILETKLNYLLQNNLLPEPTRKWLLDVYGGVNNKIELSDAFIAILSNTTRDGNSMKAPLQAIHENGVIPKHLLPLREDMTWDEYHNPARITNSMKKLGQEFLKHIKINYGQEYDFKNFIEKDLISVGGYAWPEPVNGVYPRVDYQPNHAFVLYKPLYEAFDNYLDRNVFGDFTKSLAPDYAFINYGYRLAINIGEIVDEEVKKKELSIIQNILSLIQKVISIIMNEPQPTPEVKPDVKPDFVKLEPVAEPVTPTPTPPKYDWTTPEACKHSARVCMDEYKLSWNEKNLLCAVIQAESGFRVKAININKNGSKDYSLCQFNDGPPKVPSNKKWWIGEGKDFKDAQDVYDNPERQIRVMIREYKKGNLRAWYAYSNGSFRRYL